jgi:hypothetical protein
MEHLMVLKWYYENQLAKERLKEIAVNIDNPEWLEQKEKEWLNERKYWNLNAYRYGGLGDEWYWGEND